MDYKEQIEKDKLDELIEWVNMEYPNFNLEDFNNKAKEIKDGK